MSTNFAAAKDPAPATVRGLGEFVHVFSTCPSSLTASTDYAARVAEIARWSEAAACTGILVHTDNSLVDPWLVSQIIIQNTRALSPLVSVQPVYMHPYSAAKMVATLGFLHARRVFLNMVAGGFKNDLAALNDTTPHGQRYDRLIEYTQIIQELVNRRLPLTFEGKYYQVKNLTLRPQPAADLHPGILMSGASEAGLAAARVTGAVAMQYPEPLRAAYPESSASASASPDRRGARIGIVTRPNEDEAWDVAFSRYPGDKLAFEARETYWLYPFENYQTNCPYLVGSYGNVARALARYIALGFHTFLLDIPAVEEEFFHTGKVFQAAAAQGAAS